MLCGVRDLTTELRPARAYLLPVPICNPCWPAERRALTRARLARAVAREQERADASASRTGHV